LYEDDDIRDDLDSILINTVASTIPNDGRLNFFVGCKFGTDWQTWMKFGMEVMVLKMTSTSYYLISSLQPFQNGGRLNF
jgi:hypothetical protein